MKKDREKIGERQRRGRDRDRRKETVYRSPGDSVSLFF
jgi:hypothetical protein